VSKNPIVLISEAERRLEEVSEIVDILDYRDHVRAIEAMLQVISGAVELQQRATLLRLKPNASGRLALAEHRDRQPELATTVLVEYLRGTRHLEESIVSLAVVRSTARREVRSMGR